MQSDSGILGAALGLILSGDADLIEIVGLSLRVTLSAVLLSCAIGLPLGAAVGAWRFPGRGLLAVLLNALMACRRLSSAWPSISCSRPPARSARCACFILRPP